MKDLFLGNKFVSVVIAAAVLSASCTSSNKGIGKTKLPDFFKIGHRGTRGLMPENTIPAMTRALLEGANTIEFDVHISKDGQVLVYHDESFNPDYTTMPDGSAISREKRKDYTFYQLPYAEIRKFIVGEKPYPSYPQQQRIRSYTPLLSELIDSVEQFTKANNLPAPYYLLEVKSKEKTDGYEQPAPEEYMKMLMNVVVPKRLGRRLFIQSFDMRPLQVLHREYPDVKLGFLTDDKNATFEGNISKLGFQPALYNPNFKLVTEELVNKCHSNKILIQPWTVNTIEDMKRMKGLKVDGIITDYPNLFKDL